MRACTNTQERTHKIYPHAHRSELNKRKIEWNKIHTQTRTRIRKRGMANEQEYERPEECVQGWITTIRQKKNHMRRVNRHWMILFLTHWTINKQYCPKIQWQKVIFSSLCVWNHWLFFSSSNIIRWWSVHNLSKLYYIDPSLVNDRFCTANFLFAKKKTPNVEGNRTNYKVFSLLLFTFAFGEHLVSHDSWMAKKFQSMIFTMIEKGIYDCHRRSSFIILMRTHSLFT